MISATELVRLNNLSQKLEEIYKPQLLRDCKDRDNADFYVSKHMANAINHFQESDPAQSIRVLL